MPPVQTGEEALFDQWNAKVRLPGREGRVPAESPAMVDRNGFWPTDASQHSRDCQWTTGCSRQILGYRHAIRQEGSHESARSGVQQGVAAHRCGRFGDVCRNHLSLLQPGVPRSLLGQSGAVCWNPTSRHRSQPHRHSGPLSTGATLAPNRVGISHPRDGCASWLLPWAAVTPAFGPEIPNVPSIS